MNFFDKLIEDWIKQNQELVLLLREKRIDEKTSQTFTYSEKLGLSDKKLENLEHCCATQNRFWKINSFCWNHLYCRICASRRANRFRKDFVNKIPKAWINDMYWYKLWFTLRHKNWDKLVGLLDVLFNVKENLTRQIRNSKHPKQKTKSFFTQFHGILLAFEIINEWWNWRHAHFHGIWCTKEKIEFDKIIPERRIHTTQWADAERGSYVAKAWEDVRLQSLHDAFEMDWELTELLGKHIWYIRNPQVIKSLVKDRISTYRGTYIEQLNNEDLDMPNSRKAIWEAIKYPLKFTWLSPVDLLRVNYFIKWRKLITYHQEFLGLKAIKEKQERPRYTIEQINKLVKDEFEYDEKTE